MGHELILGITDRFVKAEKFIKTLYNRDMNMFKPTAAKTPEEYIDLIQDPERKVEIIKIDELIKKTVPDLKPFILAGMIGYGSFPYRGAGGKMGVWSLIALASQKNYISVYICSIDGGEYIAEKFKDKLPKANIGKSCIRFKRTADIDLEVLKEIIKRAEKVGFNLQTKS